MHGQEQLYAHYQHAPVPASTWQRAGDDWLLVDFNHAAAALTYGRINGRLGTTARLFFHDQPTILDDLAHAYDQGTIRREITTDLGFAGTQDLTLSYVALAPDRVVVYIEDMTAHKMAQR